MSSWSFVARIAIVAAVLGLVLELLVRVAYPGLEFGARVFEPSDGPHAYVLSPRGRVRAEVQGRATMLTIGRDRHRTTPGAAKGRPLHLVGDSQVFGWGLGDDETIGANLQARLGEGWRVINHGVPGYGPGDYLEILTTLPADDTVILLLTEANDLTDMILEGRAVVGRCGYLTTSWIGEKLPCPVFSARAAQWLLSRLGTSRRRAQMTPLQHDPSAMVAARVLRGRLARRLAEARRTRRTLLVSTVPWDADIEPDRRENYLPPPSTASMALPSDVDMRACFAEPGATEASLYLADDQHLSPRGARFVAACLADALHGRLAQDDGVESR